MKTCHKCNVSKPETEYDRDIECVGGRKHRCKACIRAYQIEREKTNPTNNPVSVPPEGKVCATCGEVKAANQFHRDKRNSNGVKSDCKECLREKQRAYARTNHQIRREWYRMKVKSDPNFSIKKRAYKKAIDIKYKFKKKARMKLRRSVKIGRTKQFPCEVCGDPNSQGHHEDYSKALEVRWLCQKHHGEVHRKYK